jgi:hypothetical protein
VNLLGCNLASIRICIQGYLERPVRFLYIGTFVTKYQRVWGGGLGVRAERRLSEDRQSWECEDGLVLRKEKVRHPPRQPYFILRNPHSTLFCFCSFHSSLMPMFSIRIRLNLVYSLARVRCISGFS